MKASVRVFLAPPSLHPCPAVCWEEAPDCLVHPPLSLDSRALLSVPDQLCSVTLVSHQSLFFCLSPEFILRQTAYPHMLHHCISLTLEFSYLVWVLVASSSLNFNAAALKLKIIKHLDNLKVDYLDPKVCCLRVQISVVRTNIGA